jgi:copper chaperone CopZ
MVETVRCEHCGAECKHPVTKVIDGRALNFCCMGCLGVYELLREEGAHPGQGDGTPNRDKLIAAVREVGDGVATERLELTIGGMTCANCERHVADALRSVPGTLSANVTLATGQATVEAIPGTVSIAGLKRAVEDAGYEVLNLGDSPAQPLEQERAQDNAGRSLSARFASIWKRGPKR